MTYLNRISQVRDELAAVGVVVPSAELVRTALCCQLFCTIVGLAEEPPVDKHDKCLFPVYQMIRLCA